MFKPCSFILSCFLCILLLLGSCAHSNFDVSGIVVSKKKKAIPDVAVLAFRYDGYDTVYTDSLGRFTISVFEGGLKLKGKSYVYVCKDGYKTRSRVTVRKDKVNYIKLKKQQY